MRIWHFGDSHGNHRQLEVPEAIDIAIFSGDAGTYMDKFMNEHLVRDFISWFGDLDIKHKIMIAGNHDSSIEFKLITRACIMEAGILYLENDSVTVRGFKVWGSPHTPTFGDWSFMKSRSKIHRVWDLIPDDTDILVTHGPPKGILDLTENYNGMLEMCGCSNLYKQVTQRVQPKLHLFGHIHNRYKSEYHNAAMLKLSWLETIFSNGSVCEDGNMSKVTTNGNILTI